MATRGLTGTAFRIAALTSATGKPIRLAAISVCPSTSSVSPCAAKIASSRVGGSKRSEVRTLDGFFFGAGINVASDRTIWSFARLDGCTLKQRTPAGEAGECMILNRTAV
jgi:hypothetical protein